MLIKFYLSSSGRSPVADFIKTLDKPDRAKILGCLESVEELGLNSPRVQFRQLEAKLWEIKITTQGGGYRIFYVCLRTDILILFYHLEKSLVQKNYR